MIATSGPPRSRPWLAAAMCALIAPVAAWGVEHRASGPAGPAGTCTADSTLELPAHATGAPNQSVTLTLSGNVAAGTLAVNAQFQWDPAVITAVSAAVAPGLPPGWSLDAALTPGQAAISLYGTSAIAGVHDLVAIQFTVVGGLGASTPLHLTFGEVNEVTACLVDGMFSVCSQPSEINMSVRLDKTPVNATIDWADAPGPYDVYRGSKAANAAFAYDHTCLATDVAGSSTGDSDTPLPNQLFYYLVSRVNACSESSLGTGNAGAQRPNTSPCGP